MPADPCHDWVNEVDAFRTLLEQWGFSGNPVRTEIVVVGDDLAAARRFAKTTDLEQEILYVPDQACNQLLQSFGQSVVTLQMLLVDPDDGGCPSGHALHWGLDLRRGKGRRFCGQSTTYIRL